MSFFLKSVSVPILFLSAAALHAQATAPRLLPSVTPAVRTERQAVPALVPVQSSFAPQDAHSPQASPVVQKATDDYNVWALDYNRRVFENQRTYSKIIFLMVNLLVIAGLYFAWIQFKATLHLSQHIQAKTAVTPGDPSAAKPADPAPVPADPSPEPMTQLKIGLDGVAVSSSFIGLIVLGFSMGFYFFYLQYVYPIHSVEPPAATLTQPSASH